jgi:hypothetical protein
MESGSLLSTAGFTTTQARYLRKLKRQYVSGERGDTFSNAERDHLRFVRWMLSTERIEK